MRIVKYTSRFRRDYRREKSGRHGERLDAALLETVAMLAKDEPLLRRYFDHPLSGEWSDHRDCHIRPDLILIYRKPDDASLELVRLGSHSELGRFERFGRVRCLECPQRQARRRYQSLRQITGQDHKLKLSLL
jgi:mRNA interferase YafQ